MARRQISFSRGLMRLRRIVRNDQLILGMLAVLVGLGAGGCIIVFRESISLIQTVFYGSGTERLSQHIETLPLWWVVAAPAVGGLVVGFLRKFVVHRPRSSGVADVIAATALRGGRMSLTRGARTALVDAVSIGVGASVGREGPAVHIGASLGGWVAKSLHLTRSLSRSLLGCGVAAAVAASFNAPIAGALFANEVVIGHYALSAFAPIVIASVVGTMTSHAYFGPHPAFIIPEHVIRSFWEIPSFALLGVIAAFVAVLFMRATGAAAAAGRRAPGPPWLRPAIGGALVGGLAVLVPQVIGLGYGATEAALMAALPLSVLLAALVAKIAATAISFGFGFGGGVFSPSLVIGAMLGGAYGTLMTLLFPDLSSGASAYAVVGMGAVAAAVLGAPISTTLIVFEMTGDYALTMAVMVAVVVCTVVAKQLFGHSYFSWQLAERGLDLTSGLEARLLRAIPVRRVMTPECERLDLDVRLPGIRAKLQASEVGELFVLRGDGTLYGTITLADLSELAFDPAVDDLITASDVARLHPPVLAVTDGLDAALQKMRDTGESHIAVVENLKTLKFLGCIHERDVMAAYNRALIESRREERE